MSSVKRLVLILILLSLCGLTTACNPSDKIGAKRWRRTEPCPVVVETHEEARKLLAEAPQCIDEAIAAMARFARVSAEAQNDLAGALYVRAQREHSATDLLRALDVADQAVGQTPQSVAANFNRALIQEAIGFYPEAFGSWKRVLQLDSRSQWAAEARRHRDRLEPLSIPAPARWEGVRTQIRAALRTNDNAALRSLVHEWPAATTKLIEYELLPDCRTSAERLAKIVWEVTGQIRYTVWTPRDPYRVTLVEPDTIATGLSPRAQDAVSARELWNRALDLYGEGLYVQAITTYQKALELYTRHHDVENMVNMYVRIAGLYRLVGNTDDAANEIVRALQLQEHAGSWDYRHGLLGELALVLRAAGSDGRALEVQEKIVDEARCQLELYPAAPRLPLNLSVALRALAGYETESGRLEAAAAHAIEASKLLPDEPLAQSRIAEVEGQIAMRKDPRRAIFLFTRAIALVEGQNPTFHATLYAQRAEAYFALDNREAALDDLQSAVKILQAEEQGNLQGHARDEGQEIWTSYFERFRALYDRLIDETMEHEPAKAFCYNEQARSAEPLNLLQQYGLIPTDLSCDVASVQKALPPDTYILQYAVLEERTYVWIIAHDRMDPITLEVRRDEVEHFTDRLQDDAQERNYERFERHLEEPYAALFARAMQSIHRKNPRIVIVPDKPMHGLPFAALRVSKEHYLVQDATIEVASSAALYLASLRRDADLPQEDSPSILLLGDPAFDAELPSAENLSRLPAARDEVAKIAEYYETARMLIGEDATAAEFLDDAPKFPIVHVAAHAIANERVPYLSFLLLAPQGDHSGALDANQLLTGLEPGKTRLAVLSTCSSVGGQTVGSGGLAPLVRPLIGSGIPAVLGTLWNIEDATTKQLVVSFHRHYTNGKDAAAALQAAQLELLGDKKHAAFNRPLVWGSFQVIGHASTPFKENHLDQLHSSHSLQRARRLRPQ